MIESSYLWYLMAYLLGSVPFAFIYGKLFHKIDIRNQGSGNSGATNSLRVFGKTAGIVVLALDFLKGFLPIFYLKNSYAVDILCLVGVFSVTGHVFSIFMKFKGGKGVATSLGVISALSPVGALLSIVAFVLCIFFSKMVSLGSLLGALIFLIYALFTFGILSPQFYISLFLLSLLVFKHISNIKAIIAGNERKI